MIIQAKFASFCKVCQREIRTGDRISYQRGEKQVSHATCSEEGRELAAKLEVSRRTESDFEVPAPDGLSFLAYQRAGVEFLIERPRAILGDEMGLGKTVQVIGLVNAMRDGGPCVPRVLIVCPASLKENWRREFVRWDTRGLDVAIFPKRGHVTIVNYEQARKIGELPEGAAWDLVAVDEAHFIKNPKAARSKTVYELCRHARRVVLMTGTPILNKPVELWPLLQLVDAKTWDPPGLKGKALVGEGEGAGFFRFAKRYCDARKVYVGRKAFWDFDGSSNLEELQERLRSTVMVRRLKKDVLSELPPKRRQTIVIDPRAEDAQYLDEERGCFVDGDLEETKKRVAFTDISKVRARLAMSKAEAVAEHVQSALESGSEKIVLFCHHIVLANRLVHDLQHYGATSIMGHVNVAERAERVDRFQNDPECRVIVGTIGAMGVGLTLTAASHVVFAELDWTPANVTQAEDRCHRIGQRESVLVQHIVFRGSLDERIVELLVQKQEIADLALDTETFDDLTDRKVRELDPIELSVCEARRTSALGRLRFLADRCDGAAKHDGMGFNKLDTAIGKALAKRSSLSARQTLLAERMLIKYRGQLEGRAA